MEQRPTPEPSAAAKFALEVARRAWVRVFGRRSEPEPRTPDLEGQAASDLIGRVVAGHTPAMVARLGAVELLCLLNHAAIHSDAPRRHRAAAFVRGEMQAFWWREATLNDMRCNAGFFPPDPALLDRFAERMHEDMRLVDILGSWLPGEEQFRDRLAGATTVRLRDLEPYYCDRPWTEALEGQTVLVVHPFDETIRAQYARRELLFSNQHVLPEFQLKTLKAVQSIAATPTRFRDWFEALASMEEAVADLEFDVALLGCGAYGFPLAAHVKRLGRRAVHLGGATQILFGIKGRRWDRHNLISRMYNDYWVRPSEAERPEAHLRVEDGCYW